MCVCAEYLLTAYFPSALKEKIDLSYLNFGSRPSSCHTYTGENRRLNLPVFSYAAHYRSCQALWMSGTKNVALGSLDLLAWSAIKAVHRLTSDICEPVWPSGEALGW